MRLIILLLFLGLFGGLAFYIHDKQQNHYGFLSFQMDGATQTIIINDIDQLRRKTNSFAEVSGTIPPPAIDSAASVVFANNLVKYNEHVGQSCFLSFNATDFVIAFKNIDLSVSDFVTFINANFSQNWFVENGMLVAGNKRLFVERVADFLVLSSQELMVNPIDKNQAFDHADFIVYRDTSSYERHILTNKYHHIIINGQQDGEVYGRPVEHERFFRKLPKSFDTFQFYGSTRFTKDQDVFLNKAAHDQFNWVSDGILLVHKDSFQLLISPQNDERDLRLILEEQTLLDQMDTIQINSINLKSFEIMPFKSTFKWATVIPGITKEFRYYMEFENFNILTNSIGAMRWYISAIQTGDLLSYEDVFSTYYKQVVPSKLHHLAVSYEGENKEGLVFNAKIWNKTGGVKNANTAIVLKETQQNKQVALSDFEVGITPSRIDVIDLKDEKALLLSNDKAAVAYAKDGKELWRYDFPEKLVAAPQIIDFENDQKSEIVFFMNRLVVILRSNGAQISGWTKKMNEPVYGGTCLNYDNKFDYRILINKGSSILAFDEKGDVVNGFNFKGMNGGLVGGIDYALINGKDYISFKDQANQLYTLTRRGENRFNKIRTIDLPNETDFLLGEKEATIRKMGYDRQYIYSYYVKDGNLDSVKLDKRANPIRVFWLQDHASPRLVVEEVNRVLVIDKFGYVENEIVKPTNAKRLIAVNETENLCFVLFDDINNSLYLLNNEGKMVVSNAIKSTEVFKIFDSQIYTYDGLRLKAYKLN